jgi:uncharacterized damage-inducible protein DinB
MAVERTDPPYRRDERAMLEAWLEYHRATLEMKCDGLTPEQLRERSVPPSSLSLLGLVRHMAEVERSWFRRTLAGEDAGYIYCDDDFPDGDFDRVDSANPDEGFATWRAECARARENAAAVDSLDAVGLWKRTGEDVSLRWIYVHMIEEYARHNGHADLLRERIDGAVGE